MVALSILSELNELAAKVPLKVRDAFFKCILTAIIKLCECFPPLCDEAIQFLLYLCQFQSINTNVDLYPKTTLMKTSTTLVNSQADPIISKDPVQGMENRLIYLQSVSLQEGIYWVFRQITKIVILPVAGKN